jgi:hypothetical protein
MLSSIFWPKVCSAVYILDMISWFPPHRHSSLYLANERVRNWVYTLVRPKMSAVPFILNDVWSVLMPLTHQQHDHVHQVFFIAHYFWCSEAYPEPRNHWCSLFRDFWHQKLVCRLAESLGLFLKLYMMISWLRVGTETKNGMERIAWTWAILICL